ncbi:hypothetical protein M3Y97_00140800 [Aphelenchoides bicaudatus]|nr:hypothetical protein M3Y97_00140800 [Aphelenchoides bicaudatus]
MKICIQKLETDGDAFDLDVESHHTVKWVKALIMAKTREQIVLQHLFHDGKELEDQDELQHCRIYNDSVLYLLVDADPSCALSSRIDNLNQILKDMSKAKLFKKI